MSDWQPIETAPRDGTLFLAFARSNHNRRYWGLADWNLHLSEWWWEHAISPQYWQPLIEPSGRIEPEVTTYKKYNPWPSR